MPFYLGIFAALLTAFYMTRREEAHNSDVPLSKSESPHVGCYEAHESPPVMTIPLLVLAAFSVLLGFIGTPAWPWFQGFLNG